MVCLGLPSTQSHLYKDAYTAKALFDVDDYESYVEMITETALRHVASLYSYDHMDDDANANSITLRTNIEEVSETLKAVMASNLMVVLCGDSEAQPVVNTGTLYQKSEGCLWANESNTHCG